MTKEQAECNVAAAERGCAEVNTAWEAALRALSGEVAVNWYGVYSDPAKVRSTLGTARDCINVALQALECVQWPTDADYDEL